MYSEIKRKCNVSFIFKVFIYDLSNLTQ